MAAKQARTDANVRVLKCNPDYMASSQLKAHNLFYLKKYLGPPWASTACPALSIVGRDAAMHIMVVLMTSRGVVAAAANAPAQAPMAKSSCDSIAAL